MPQRSLSRNVNIGHAFSPLTLRYAHEAIKVYRSNAHFSDTPFYRINIGIAEYSYLVMLLYVSFNK